MMREQRQKERELYGINQVFLYLITDNKYAVVLYSGIFPPGRVTSMFDIIPAIISEMDNIYFWLFFPIFFVIDDLWFYGYHRLVHAVPFLYKHVSYLTRNPFCSWKHSFRCQTPLIFNHISLLSGSHGAPPVFDSFCHNFTLYTSRRNCATKCWRGRWHSSSAVGAVWSSVLRNVSN